MARSFLNVIVKESRESGFVSQIIRVDVKRKVTSQRQVGCCLHHHVFMEEVPEWGEAQESDR